MQLSLHKKVINKNHRDRFQIPLLILAYLFQMHSFSTPRKPYSFLIFSRGKERVHWEQMGLVNLRKLINFYSTETTITPSSFLMISVGIKVDLFTIIINNF